MKRSIRSSAQQLDTNGHYLALIFGGLLAVIFAPRDADGAEERERDRGWSISERWGRGGSSDSFDRFADWAVRWDAGKQASAPEVLLAEGLELAAERRRDLARLVDEDPELALAQAVPLDTRATLPAEVQALLETRIEGWGAYGVVAVDRWLPGGMVAGHVERDLRIDGQRYRARVYGWRLGQPSKGSTPVRGIALDGVVALHASIVRRVSNEEVAQREEGGRRQGLGLASGPTAGRKLPVLVGDRWVEVTDASEMELLEQRLRI